MPRTARASVGGLCYHVLNRGNAGMPVFRKDGDYGAFVALRARPRGPGVPGRLIGCCLMSNHFHLAHAAQPWPAEEGSKGPEVIVDVPFSSPLAYVGKAGTAIAIEIGLLFHTYLP